MRVERLESERAGLVVGAWIGGALVAGAALAALWLRLGLPIPSCLFREWTGIPCPSCGSTRMVEALLSGDVSGALACNPLVFAGLAALGVWAVASTARVLFRLPVWRITFEPRERLRLRILAIAALVASWSYLIWRGP